MPPACLDAAASLCAASITLLDIGSLVQLFVSIPFPNVELGNNAPLVLS